MLIHVYKKKTQWTKKKLGFKYGNTYYAYLCTVFVLTCGTERLDNY